MPRIRKPSSKKAEMDAIIDELGEEELGIHVPKKYNKRKPPSDPYSGFRNIKPKHLPEPVGEFAPIPPMTAPPVQTTVQTTVQINEAPPQASSSSSSAPPVSAAVPTSTTATTEEVE